MADLNDLRDNPGLIEKLKLPKLPEDKCIKCHGELPHPKDRIILGLPANPAICPDCHYDAAGEWIENQSRDNSYIDN